MIKAIKQTFNDPATARKGWVAFCGFTAAVLTQGLIPESAESWVTCAIAGLTLAGVWGVPNKEAV